MANSLLMGGATRRGNAPSPTVMLKNARADGRFPQAGSGTKPTGPSDLHGEPTLPALPVSEDRRPLKAPGAGRALNAWAKPDPSRIQIQPSRAKPAQRQSKKTARFSLDFLVRIEPFQGLARTPWPGNIFGSSPPAQKHRAATA